MPSGSKKRKAAKRKKEKEAAVNPNDSHHPTDAVATPSNGDDDLKHHDDKESDAEEVSSPASDDHPKNHHEFTDGDREKVKKSEDSRTTRTRVEKCVTQIEEELKPTGELNSKSAIVEEVEPKRETGDGVLFRNMDEENVVQIQHDLKPVEEVEPKKEAVDVVLPQSLGDGCVIQIQSDLKPIDELETKKVTNEHVEILKESRDGDLLQNQEEEGPYVVDKTNVVEDDAPFVGSTEAVNSFSEGLTHVPNIIAVGENYKSAMEIEDVDKMDKIILFDEKINGIQSASAKGRMTADVVVLETKENGGKVMISQESNGGMLPVSVDLGSENEGVREIVKTDDLIATSDVKVSASQDTEEKLMLSYSAPRSVSANVADSTYSAEHKKDSKVPESSGSQDLGVSAPRIVHRASWMNCCGLFEVFGGSDR